MSESALSFVADYWPILLAFSVVAAVIVGLELVDRSLDDDVGDHEIH